MVMTINTIGTN